MTPLYLSEPQIAVLVLGRASLEEWRALVPVLERKGLPTINPLIGPHRQRLEIL